MQLALRLLCSVTPWAVAGLRFGRGPSRAYGIIQRPIDQFAEADLRALFADPHVDVSVGVQAPTGDWAFVPAADILDLARLQQLLSPPIEQPGPRRDTLQVIADHHRIEAERNRDAALPGGDDERTGEPVSTNATGAAPVEPAAGGIAAQPDEAPTETEAEGGASGTSATTPAPTTSLAPPDAPVRARRAPAKK